MPFPEFESENGEFAARVPLEGSAEFREFLRKRSQALTQLEEIIVLRVLWSKDAAGLSELASRMQRKKDVAARVLEGMERKSMVERAGAPDVFSLPSIIRRDIETIFQSDQLSLDQSLWGG